MDPVEFEEIRGDGEGEDYHDQPNSPIHVETFARFWNFDSVYSILGGHPAHLKQFCDTLIERVQTLIAQTKDLEKTELIDAYAEFKVSERPPLDVADDILRECGRTWLHQELKSFNLQVGQFKRTLRLRLGVEDMAGSDYKSPAELAEVLETLRAICQRGVVPISPDDFSSLSWLEGTGKHGVTTDALVKHVVLSLLEANLLVPKFEPTRLAFPNRFVALQIANWVDHEYHTQIGRFPGTPTSLSKMRYNMRLTAISRPAAILDAGTVYEIAGVADDDADSSICKGTPTKIEKALLLLNNS